MRLRERACPESSRGCSRKRSRICAAAIVLVAGCAESIDPAPIGDYTGWKRVDITGNAPGHTASYRILYINDIAADPTTPLYIGYPEGSILVKEVHEIVDGRPGELRYVAMMRRLGPVTRALEDQGGWLFSEAQTPGGSETHADFCWNRCHIAAPYNGAWYDYRK
jgi:hypothetical protein